MDPQRGELRVAVLDESGLGLDDLIRFPERVLQCEGLDPLLQRKDALRDVALTVPPMPRSGLRDPLSTSPGFALENQIEKGHEEHRVGDDLQDLERIAGHREREVEIQLPLEE